MNKFAMDKDMEEKASALERIAAAQAGA